MDIFDLGFFVIGVYFIVFIFGFEGFGVEVLGGEKCMFIGILL